MTRRYLPDDSIDAKRLQSLRLTLAVCQVAQSFGRAFTLDEIFDAYRSRIGEISKRTLRRYLYSLANAGMIDIGRDDEPNKPFLYLWLGWPGAIE